MSNPKRCLSLVTPVFYREDQPMPAPMVAPEPVVSLTRVDVVLAHPVATVSATSAAGNERIAPQDWQGCHDRYPWCI